MCVWSVTINWQYPDKGANMFQKSLDKEKTETFPKGKVSQSVYA